MKKTLLLCLLILQAVLPAQETNIGNVTIKVKPDNLPPEAKVYITGNHILLGEWNPQKIELIKDDQGLWSRSFQINKGERLEFKFTLGSWEREALDENGQVHGNHSLIVMNDTVLLYNIDRWSTAAKRIAHGKITGRVEYIKDMEGEGILDRDIIIWLPPSYNKDKSRRYPVLYMHDGQNIIDPATSSFGYDWRVDDVADSLIKAGKMEEIIIVGMYSTADRTPEYSYSEKGKAYMNFIVNKLKPLIDKKYRTKPGREYTATMGSSMGGLISFMLAWEYPDIFSAAGCLSPALKIRQLDYTSSVKNYNGPKKQLRLYIDNGGKGVDPELQPGVIETVEILKAKGYREGTDMKVYFDENADHNERSWAERIWRPLMFMFARNRS